MELLTKDFFVVITLEPFCCEARFEGLEGGEFIERT